MCELLIFVEGVRNRKSNGKLTEISIRNQALHLRSRGKQSSSRFFDDSTSAFPSSLEGGERGGRRGGGGGS